jgi:predicted esterase
MIHKPFSLSSLAATLLLNACLNQIHAGDKMLTLEGDTFDIQGHTAFLIMPPEAKSRTTPTPWVWYAPTLLPKHPNKSEKWMFDQWLDQGIAIAGIDVGESYGSPEGRRLYSALFSELTRTRGLSTKVCLLARSRGGLMLYNWAAENADNIAGIAGIYPVCNLESYPGLNKAAPAYTMTADELKAALTSHNPIDRLDSLAKAQVPIFHLHGDHDRVVPLEKNSALLKTRYDALGGKMTLEVISKGGHDMNPHWFKSQALVDFVSTCLIPASR